ncbi:SusC/RagA family TonB-linked outer membrane protein [Pedobacter gandavensis]|uniref:SusC/RagA family TonB-linked outer membrane protein n=1 Tax=Pedobacter gandavensis TaxID=2679963 RepID=UPI00292D1669|nr:SusC/RagA family TonB-linked outer membrane protein [Pedobacter gandavensis]
MNFYRTSKCGDPSRICANILLKLKLTFILLITVILQVSATSYAQITLKENAVPMEQIIKKIRKQSGYDFFYNAKMLAGAKPVTIDVKNASVAEVLAHCFANQPLTYRIEEKTIVVQFAMPKPVAPKPAVVSGTVLDENGLPIPGASIRIKGNGIGATVSNKDGDFKIILPSENETILISYMGYKTREIQLKPNQQPLIVKLEVAENNMKDVVITGTGITRNKNTFTGATATFTGEQLKAVGNQNIIQGLRALDPSFVQLENNRFGSNPNVLPNIEVRGKTSISSSLQDQFAADPNQPLFILDGFETTLRTIVDLNMNRIASVVILKDAASTAMYGSKASNGVVVIETVKPRPGQMRLNYTTDLSVELPDLSGYNMMNAKEKLEFERLSGRYNVDKSFDSNPLSQLYQDSLYNSRLAEVQRGVDTYWLREPVRTGFSQRHSIYADGGDNAFRYGVGVTYKKHNGTMKGSGREDWAGNVDLSYRKGKLNISNQIYINGYESNESPYGSFSTFVNANPYYRKSNDRYLELSVDRQGVRFPVENPLYNAGLNNINRTTNFAIQNNLQMNADLSKELIFRAALQLQKGVTTGIRFLSPLHTSFDEASIFEKGSYRNSRIDNFSYNANVVLTYGKVFADAHSLTANFRADIRENDNTNLSMSAVGFPASSNGNPSFAFSYSPNSRPVAIIGKSRNNSILASANYAYKGRYLADISYRYDGSTAFGSNKKYSPYYSGGIGWNLHNETFMKAVKFINIFRLFLNSGVTGNQNFASASSLTTYGHDSFVNIYGQGVNINALGNPNLRWQNSVQTNLGTDIVMFDNKFSINANIYQKRTDPLVVAIDLPSSTGISSFPINAGSLNIKGLEATVKYSPIYKPTERIIWTIGYMASLYRGTYSGFNNQLASLNANQQRNNLLMRYKDGYSPNDIWAVPSMGIDPASGREIFRKKSGEYTFVYDANDIVKVGNEQPKIEGVFSNNVSYKGFTFGMTLRYILGREIFNTALFNKVENISIKELANNQDKRALYNRWQNPGDIAQFKGISLTDKTQMSSRFVQKENLLSAESVSFGYDFQHNKWLKTIGLSSLRLNAYMNDIFRISSVQAERGIEYPFARSVSFSLNASF